MTKLSTLSVSNLLFVLLTASKSFGAACCGGGFSFPSLLVGDDRAAVTSAISYSDLNATVDAGGTRRNLTQNQHLSSLQIAGSHIYADRFQFGAQTSVIQRSRQSFESQTHIGDTSLTAGYEYLPDWDYNPYRPKGIGFVQLTLPTGTSIYEAKDGIGLSASGRGFYTLGVGTSLTKVWGSWDAYFGTEIHRSFERTVRSASLDQDVKLEPGWGASVQAGVGWNYGDVRVGPSFTYFYEDRVGFNSEDIKTPGAVERNMGLGFSGSYMWSDVWSTTLTYLDQNLIGNPANTTLTRSVSFALRRQWFR